MNFVIKLFHCFAEEVISVRFSQREGQLFFGLNENAGGNLVVRIVLHGTYGNQFFFIDTAKFAGR